MKLKFEISNIKDIKSRFTSLIICNIISTIIGFFYISFFNIVYSNIKDEWIKSINIYFNFN